MLSVSESACELHRRGKYKSGNIKTMIFSVEKNRMPCLLLSPCQNPDSLLGIVNNWLSASVLDLVYGYICVSNTFSRQFAVAVNGLFAIYCL